MNFGYLKLYLCIILLLISIVVFMDIQNSNHECPKFRIMDIKNELWISIESKIILGIENYCSISIIHFSIMDIHCSNYGYPIVIL